MRLLSFATAVLVTSALVLYVLVWTGRTAEASPSETAPTSIPVRTSDRMVESKPLVEGTELICVTSGSYGSTSCNWELWNKTRETAK